MRTMIVTFAVIFAGLGANAAGDTPSMAKHKHQRAVAKQSLKVTSSAFNNDETIPAEYTCDGSQRPPPLAWSQPPSGTKSVAVFVDDTDGGAKGTFTHWLITGIPPKTTELPAGGSMPQGAVAGKNSKGDAGYTGPCPPEGRHHYVFHVYALDTEIALPGSKINFLSVVDGHVLAEGQLVGTYQKLTPQQKVTQKPHQ